MQTVIYTHRTGCQYAVTYDHDIIIRVSEWVNNQELPNDVPEEMIEWFKSIVYDENDLAQFQYVFEFKSL